ncbi:MAG TPA: DEAD/DEAH box helicase, partial [Acetobacteraceae bacterium]|nr:DEAD/DEAH box helicase [Acetobacteraceae bacterium]
MNIMVQALSDANSTEAELRRVLGDQTLALGRDYADRGRVLRLTVAPDTGRIEAATQGNHPDPYHQSITLSRSPEGRLSIGSRCSCPMHSGCKHVAAVLLEAARRHKLLLLNPQGGLEYASLIQAPGRPTLVPAPTRPAAPPAGAPLPESVSAWLRDLEYASKTETEDFPPSQRQRLFYTLQLMPTVHGPRALRIQPMTVSVLKDGSLGATAQTFPLARYQNRQMPAFLRPSDRTIVQRLGAAQYGADDPRAEETLRMIIASGRARWGDLKGLEPREAAPRKSRLGWELQEDGSQRPVLHLAPPAVAMLIPAPWFVEPETGLLGPLEVDMPAGVASRLLRAPPVPLEHVERVRTELTRRVPHMALPQPDVPPPPEVLDAPLRPHLLLTTADMPVPGYGRYLGGEVRPQPLAKLRYGYGPFLLAMGDRRPVMARERRLYRLTRDADAEAAAHQRLQALGLTHFPGAVSSWHTHPWLNDLMLPSDEAWIAFLLRDAPELRRDGWTVEVADNFPFRLAEAEGEWTAELAEGSGIDWLELHLGVMVDGQRIDLVPALLAMIESADRSGADLAQMVDGHDGALPFLVPLRDGRLLSLPLGRIRPILLALWELFNGGGLDPSQGARITKLDATSVAALEEVAGVVWQGGEAVRALGRMLREAGDRIPQAKVPAVFRGALRPYQAQGVDWLQFLRSAELGGILADDMGLGKTVQTLAHLLIEQDAGRLTKPALIVCPTSLVPNWTLEAERFAPSLKLLALHGPARKQHFGRIPEHDVVLTTYPLLARDHAVLTAQDWHIVVLDEAQTIKNPNAETTRQALQLKASQRLCLSGTPLQNHLGELWSLFDFLAPGFLGSARHFRTRFRTPIEKHGDAPRQALLSKRVKPFLLRRTKEEVAVELPPKTEITEPVEMEAAQRGVYDAIRLAMHSRVKAAIAAKGLARSGIIILDALLKLRQACCDPRLLKLDSVRKTKAGSAKLERLMELLTVMLEEGRRVLLFSQFTEMLALIERALHDAKIDYVMLTGDTIDRATPVRRFQAGEVPLFLISLKAGGVGLNLTAADTVIHYDPWWNPAVEDQATDRAHRIGQDKRVFVHRLVTLGTIEEKMEL